MLAIGFGWKETFYLRKLKLTKIYYFIINIVNNNCQLIKQKKKNFKQFLR